MTKVATCLWFDGQAEEAARLYTSLIPDSHINGMTNAAADNPSTAKGAVLTVDFTLAGQDFVGLNGGPEFPFTEAISISVLCEDQAEVDHLWTSLIVGGGEPSQCGWLKDKFGVSWQIIPKVLPEMLASSDAEAAERAMKAMLTMGKLDVEQLREAYEGVPPDRRRGQSSPARRAGASAARDATIARRPSRKSRSGAFVVRASARR